jgi:hypothetical protein
MEDRPDPPRLSRQRFGDIFFTTWGCLILLTQTIDIFSWQRQGLLFWLTFGPLLGIWLAAGVPWIVLATRDVFAGRLVLRGYRLWLTILATLAAAAFVAQKLVS